MPRDLNKTYVNKAKDPEEVQELQNVDEVSEAMTPTERKMLDEMRLSRELLHEQGKEIARLKAIADQNKGAAYDHESRDKTFKGHLRFITDASDPVVWWKMVKNVSYVDPRTGHLVEDQEFQVKTRSGSVQNMSIHEWNLLKSNQTKIKFLRLDHLNGVCDVQLSTDGGQTYVGEIINDLPTTFLNP